VTGTQEPAPREVPEDLEDLDPGLAQERASLAWRRTAVSFTVVSLGVLKFAPLAGAPLLLMATGMWAVGRTGLRGLGTKAQRRAIGTIALATALTAIIALVVALLGGGRTMESMSSHGQTGGRHRVDSQPRAPGGGRSFDNLSATRSPPT
jgi:uncharacterized membrane protein YidH (DUF202 family)